MFALSAFPFPSTSLFSFLFFFISIIFATAAGVTAFLLLVCGNFEELQDKFNEKKFSGVTSHITETGEVLKSSEDFAFYIEILEEKLQSKITEFEMWKMKVINTEKEIQNINTTSGEVARRYMKLKNDLAKYEIECKQLQQQIDEYKKKQAQINQDNQQNASLLRHFLPGENAMFCMSAKKDSNKNCNSYPSFPRGFNKLKNDMPPEATGRISEVLKLLTPKKLQQMKSLSQMLSLLTLQLIGASQSHRSIRNDKSPELFQKRNGCLNYQLLSNNHLLDLDDASYMKAIEIVNFPFPSKHPPPNFITKAFLWVKNHLKSRRNTKDQAINISQENNEPDSAQTFKDTREYFLTQNGGNKKSTNQDLEMQLQVRKLLELVELESRSKSKFSPKMENTNLRKLLELLKIDDSLWVKLLSLNKEEDYVNPQSKSLGSLINPVSKHGKNKSKRLSKPLQVPVGNEIFWKSRKPKNPRLSCTLCEKILKRNNIGTGSSMRLFQLTNKMINTEDNSKETESSNRNLKKKKKSESIQLCRKKENVSGIHKTNKNKTSHSSLPKNETKELNSSEVQCDLIVPEKCLSSHNRSFIRVHHNDSNSIRLKAKDKEEIHSSEVLHNDSLSNNDISLNSLSEHAEAASNTSKSIIHWKSSKLKLSSDNNFDRNCSISNSKIFISENTREDSEKENSTSSQKKCDKIINIPVKNSKLFQRVRGSKKSLQLEQKNSLASSKSRLPVSVSSNFKVKKLSSDFEAKKKSFE